MLKQIDYTYKDRIWCGKINEKYVNQEVKLYGWVHRFRDMGGILFIDLRDRTGIVQVVVPKELKLDKLSLEDVLEVIGIVKERPQENVNPNMATGNFEVIAKDVKVLSKSDPLPFMINEDYKDISDLKIDESLRLKYRYLDLRRLQMFKNMYFRHKIIKYIRDFMDNEDFLEIETPLLAKPTPEGARDFLVPSRLQLGKFYALPQSPQLFKQILMVSGIDRYFQVAKCLRDEDLRADRQPEFTQVDIEMSFISKKDIFLLIENLLDYVLNNLGFDINIPFDVIDYSYAMDHFNSDKPDLRYNYPVKKWNNSIKININDENFDIDQTYYVFFKNLVLTRRELDKLNEFLKQNNLKFLYFISYNNEFKGSLVKFVDVNEVDNYLRKENDFNSGDYITFIISSKNYLNELILIKNYLIENKLLRPVKDFYFLWVDNFPLFKVEEEKVGNKIIRRIAPEHHPFTNVLPEDKVKVYTIYNELKKDPNIIYDDGFVKEVLSIRSLAYDLVLNGVEVASGSIRITDIEFQKIIFEIIGINEEEANKKFGFLLEAFRYGVPPHGGIALGIDRIIALLLGYSSIREVIAFPKTQSGTCLLTKAPSEVDINQLKELGIKLMEVN
ncbi:MAG: aspartate--tRNA ligase [bacterium]